MAGRDITINTTTAARPTFMSQMKEKFAHERANNVEFRSVIDSLRYYQEPIDPKRVSLQEKLELGERLSYIPEALRSKELFAKCMARHSLSQTAQEVIAYCLGRINHLFRARIVPRIIRRDPAEVVDTALVDEVIDPVLKELEENILGLMPQELTGMVYFLTANCFLWWHQRDSNADLSSGA